MDAYKSVDMSWNFQEYFSGSSAVTAQFAQSGPNSLFPVDYRYGCDIGLAAHRDLLDTVDAKFTPKIIFFTRDFTHWNGGPKKRGQEVIQELRKSDEEIRFWLVSRSETVAKRGGIFLGCSPAGSTVQKRGENYPRLQNIEGGVGAQFFAPCAWGLRNAEGLFMELRTRTDSNVKLEHALQDCPGHAGAKHGTPHSIRSGHSSYAFPVEWIQVFFETCPVRSLGS